MVRGGAEMERDGKSHPVKKNSIVKINYGSSAAFTIAERGALVFMPLAII